MYGILDLSYRANIHARYAPMEDAPYVEDVVSSMSHANLTK